MTDADYNFNDTSDDDSPAMSLDDALREMQQPEDALPSDAVLYGLANVPSENKQDILVVWYTKDITYRRVVLQNLIEIMDSEYQYEYQTLGEIALRDKDDIVRQLAVELLSDTDSVELMKFFIDMVQQDNSIRVKVEALRALGNFIRKGELGDIPEQATLPARHFVFALLEDAAQPLNLWRIALESASHCTDNRLPSYIQSAYQSNDDALQRSAVIAMGHSCDEQWADIILQELSNHDLDMRIEAARAAGMLELEDAVPFLEQMLVDTDREIQLVAIESLGRIGGERALYILERAMEVAEDMEDDDMLEILDEAITEAQFMSGFNFLGGDDFDVDAFDADEIN